ncbi:hypothetical protein OG342_07210 [Streptomyces bobili]|uniref:hypothetical protein n=1 Tax=Streptomyces bobili TaxID=67280 RepID=UPI0022592BC8|nr:hypothetical protein [Streptomyces bobili]MCX5522653.1 hypothetical protein [Streptomyces bobili]
MHVERVEGDYIQPEIIDLEGGCLFRLHASDISEAGIKPLAQLLTEQAKRWAPRPPGSPLGPVIPVSWERIPNPPDPLAIGVEETAVSITYKLDPSLISQRAADYLGRLDTARSPYWQRVPEGYHDGDDAE